MNKRQRLPWDNPRFRNWVAVVRAEKAVVRALGQVLAPYGLKVAQLDLLMNLYRHPGLSQHDLARRLLVGRSNVTMLLPPLEKRMLLYRKGDAADKRIIRLHLTPEGEALLLEALEAYSELIDRVMAHSTPEACNALGEQMERIIEELEKE